MQSSTWKYLLLLISLNPLISAHEQFAAVKGKLMCGAKPAESVAVRLYDRDVGWFFINTIRINFRTIKTPCKSKILRP
jgi:hypothetical protein